MTRLRASVAALILLTTWGIATPQVAMRRIATVASLHQYPGYYHLQNLLLHGEFVENGTSVVLRGGERDVAVLLNDQRTTSGPVEVRGQLLDVGRLESSDPRLSGRAGGAERERWPQPGEELLLSVSAVTPTQLAVSPSVRALALQPWRFDGQKVTVVGQFRGRNLFGDLPSAPGKSRYDFVLRSTDAAVWVTDLRPRGRGFDLSVDARVDTGRWLQVSGAVSFERGLVAIAGATVAVATAPEATPTAEEETPEPASPPDPGELIFSSPTDGDINVMPAGSVRLQFSRGLLPASIEGQIRVTYVGATGPDALPAPRFTHSYDLGTRAIELRFSEPLERFSTVKVEILDGMKTFDGAGVRTTTLTFSTGG